MMSKINVTPVDSPELGPERPSTLLLYVNLVLGYHDKDKDVLFLDPFDISLRLLLLESLWTNLSREL